jgi:hypothetical protein
MSAGLGYLRGAFIAYEPQGYPDRRRVIPFRFNPESITRTVTLEVGQNRPGTPAVAAGAGPAQSAESSSSDPAGGSVKETFSVQIRFDFADREESVSGLGAEFGIAPEIAAIEDLLYPAESEADAPSDGTQPIRAAAARPTVLFVWGRKRVLPVRIASLKIEESVYNSSLNPVRAEIEAALEVLGGDADARSDQAVDAALQHTNAGRRNLAQMYYDNTSAQGSNILPL